MKDQGKVSQCALLLSSAMWAQTLWCTVVRLCGASHEQLGIWQHDVYAAKSLTYFVVREQCCFFLHLADL